MSYRIIIVPSAEKELARLDHFLLHRLLKRIHLLEKEPRPHGVIKLTGIFAYRIRIGNYRVIYSIDDSAKCIRILRVAHRGETYR